MGDGNNRPQSWDSGLAAKTITTQSKNDTRRGNHHEEEAARIVGAHRYQLAGKRFPV
jgi:hypothetical protein